MAGIGLLWRVRWLIFFCFSSTFCVLFLCNFALRFWILFVASGYLVSFCLLAIVVVEVLL